MKLPRTCPNNSLSSSSRDSDGQLTTLNGLPVPLGPRGLHRWIALAINSPQAGTIVNNIAVDAFVEFDFHRAGELFAEGLEIAERFGDASNVRWLRHQCAASALIEGRWDEALEGEGAFIAECQAG